MRSKRWLLHVLILLAYAATALVLTWPVVTRVGSHVPGNGADDPPLTWNLWWVQYALLHLGANPFDCNYLFYPLGINLAFYTLTVLNGLLSFPLQAVLGLIPASNLLLLSSFVLSGYGAFLLASYLLRNMPYAACTVDSALGAAHVAFRSSHSAAFMAGLLYAFASCKLTYAALGQWNIASSQWIPFYVLCLFRMADEPRRWRYPVLAALFLLFQAYAELTYATFLLLFTAWWALWRLPALFRPESGRLWIGLALLAALFVLGLSPMLSMMIPDMVAEGDIWAEGGGFADVFSADLLGFLVPTEYHPLLGWLVELFSFDHSVGQHIYLGYSVLALAVLGAVYGRRRSSSAAQAATTTSRSGSVTFWSLSAVIFWLLSLGPTLRINGHDTGLPLPFALIAQLPFFKGNRYPSRYSVMLFLSLAILVALGLAALLQRRREPSRGTLRAVALRLVPLLLVAVLLFEHLSLPLPLSDMRVPPVYRTIAEEMPGDFTLLDVPVAWRNGSRVTGTLDPIIMFEQYYQSVHGKPILAGNTSRNPPLKFQYFTEAPVINTLIALETGHAVDPAVVEQDRALAPGVLRFFDIQAIVVHPAQAGPEMVEYVEGTMPVEPLDVDPDLIAYRVNLPPWPQTWIIEPGDELGRLSYAEGWGLPAEGLIWAQREAARLLVPLDGTEQRMSFRAHTTDAQQLRVVVNGQTAASTTMSPGWKDYEVALPPSTLRPGLNEIWLHFERLIPPGQVRLSSRTIGQTGLESPVNLVVHSAGQEVGDFGHIYVDGKDVSPNQRGYNVAVLNPQTGTVEQTAAFDTHLDGQASQALAAFLAQVPTGHIVAVAAADEASQSLSQEAVDALHRIGAAGDLRNKFRWAHAVVGVQGAAPGTALEVLDWMRPVGLVVGEGATEPHLAAAFATITFDAVTGP